MDSETQFTIKTQDNITVVSIAGDLDHDSTPKFRTVISQILESGCNKVVLDMSDTNFMDSGGMSGIIFAAKNLSEKNGRLLIANCNPRIVRKLDIGGLTKMPKILIVCDSTDQALHAALGGS